MTQTAILKPFNELAASELYQVLRLRSEVFIVEQQCFYMDQDNKDQQCYHLMLYDVDQLSGYARLLPPGLSYPEASIGRVVVNPAFRGKGLARGLMEQAIASVYELFGEQPIRIGAQFYLKKFYQSLGFVQQSEIYLEDGIEHIDMLLDVEG